MAITIHQQPNSYTPAHNPVVYVASSTNNTQPNFFYLFDVYINGAASYSARIASPSHPVHGSQYCDVSAVVSSFLAASYSTPGASFETHGNTMLCDVVVRIGERYDMFGVSTDFPNLADSVKVYCFHAAIKPREYEAWDSADYLPDTNTVSFLTDMPDLLTVSDDQHGWLSFIYRGFGSGGERAKYAEVSTFDNTGALIATTRIINNNSTITTNAQRFQTFPFAPRSLNLIPGADIVIGSQPIITANTHTYTINLLSSALAQTTEERSFKVNRDCNPFGQAEIHWLNRFGGFDSFSFKARVDEPTEVAAQTYQRPEGELSATAWDYDASRPTSLQYSTMIKDGLIVHTGYLRDAEARYVADLVLSPLHYLMLPDGEGTRVPLTLKTRTIAPQSTIANGRVMYVFEFTVRNEYTAQRQ